MRQVAVPVCVEGGLPARPPSQHTRRSIGGETMGTTWRVELFASPQYPHRDLERAVSQELDRLVAQMSHWREDSDLSRFNNSRHDSWVDLPAELCYVLEASLAVGEETAGAFDATVGPLVEMWGFGPSQTRVEAPLSQFAIAEGRNRRGSQRVCLDCTHFRALQPGGVSFDLSSIAKGFAVDRISELLDTSDISSCLVDIGGELRARGVKPNGEPWWVAIETPPGEAEFPETLVALCNLSIASSGDYRRFFEHEGRRYTHTIDPRTGCPIRHPVVSITVLHERCMLADAYSTALAVLGPEEGIAFADRLGLAAHFVLREERGYLVRCSRVFREMLDE